jgi:hypothetical protein
MTDRKPIVNVSGSKAEIPTGDYLAVSGINLNSTAQTVCNGILNINDFGQFNIQNTSTGTLAQSGYAATADNGTATSGFVWMGINNSTFSNPQTYNIGSVNDVSFMGSGQDMYIANVNQTKSIIFSTGNSTTPFFNERMRITNAGNVGIGTIAPNTSAILDMSGVTTKGMLLPKVSLVSLTDVTTIATPATGLLIWNTNASLVGGVGFYYNDGTPTAAIWAQVGSDVTASLQNWTESNYLYSSQYGVKLTPISAQTNVDVVIQSKGTGGFRLTQADGGSAPNTGGNNLGGYAVDLCILRSAATQVASGSFSVNIGSYSTASGAYSVCISQYGIASGTNSFCTNYQGIASGTGSVNLAYGGTASGNYSKATGLYSKATIYGMNSHASGQFTTAGDAQREEMVLRGTTTTSTVLTADQANATNQLVLATYQSVIFTAQVIAKQTTSTTNVAAWIVKGVASRGSTAASTVVSMTSIETLINPNGWTISATADTTNGAVSFTVTSASSAAIACVADVVAVAIIY